jgi:hypothetical protein
MPLLTFLNSSYSRRLPQTKGMERKRKLNITTKEAAQSNYSMVAVRKTATAKFTAVTDANDGDQLSKLYAQAQAVYPRRARTKL